MAGGGYYDNYNAVSSNLSGVVETLGSYLQTVEDTRGQYIVLPTTIMQLVQWCWSQEAVMGSYANGGLRVSR